MDSRAGLLVDTKSVCEGPYPTGSEAPSGISMHDAPLAGLAFADSILAPHPWSLTSRSHARSLSPGVPNGLGYDQVPLLKAPNPDITSLEQLEDASLALLSTTGVFGSLPEMTRQSPIVIDNLLAPSTCVFLVSLALWIFSVAFFLLTLNGRTLDNLA
jgi:hypothetical protein